MIGDREQQNVYSFQFNENEQAMSTTASALKYHFLWNIFVTLFFMMSPFFFCATSIEIYCGSELRFRIHNPVGLAYY